MYDYEIKRTLLLLLLSRLIHNTYNDFDSLAILHIDVYITAVAL